MELLGLTGNIHFPEMLDFIGRKLMTEHEKIYLTAESLLRDSFLLAEQILKDGFIPNFIVAVWRGGTPVGIAVQELLQYAGIPTNHIAIRTSYYTGIGETKDSVRVHGLGYLIRELNHGDSLLIVDDVFDSGRSIDAIITALEQRTRRNMPGDVRVATPWYKPGKNKTDRAPDFYIHETDAWLVFPHELQGLTATEVVEGKPGIADIVSRYGS